MLVELVDDHFDACLYALLYYLLDYMVRGIQILETLYDLDSCTNEQFNLHIKQEKRILQTSGTRLMKTVNMMRRSSKEALSQ